MAFFETSQVNPSALSEALKVDYQKLVNQVAAQKFPFIASLKKKPVMASGKTVNHTIKYSPGGIAGANALSLLHKEYEADAGSVECVLLWKKLLGFKSIDGLAYDLMSRSKESYVDGTTEAQEDVTMQIMKRAEAMAFGDVHGHIGRMNGAISTLTCTLREANDVLNFHVNMYVTFCSDEVGATSAATTYVTAVDPVAGTIDVASSSGIASDDYIFPYGDASGTLAATNTGKWTPGLSAWIPVPTAATTRALMTGDAYVFGCTRSTDPLKLAGSYYYGATATSRKEVLLNALARASRINGCRSDRVIMNPAQLNALIIELEGQVQYTQVPTYNTKGIVRDVGASAVSIITPNGKVDIMESSYCPVNNAWHYSNDVVHLKVINKEFPHIDDIGGIWQKTQIRTSGGGTLSTTADLDRYFMIAKGNLIIAIDDPSQCGSIVFPSLSSY